MMSYFGWQEMYDKYIINKADALVAFAQDGSQTTIRGLSKREIETHQVWMPKLQKACLSTWGSVYKWLDRNVPRWSNNYDEGTL